MEPKNRRFPANKLPLIGLKTKNQENADAKKPQSLRPNRSIFKAKSVMPERKESSK